MELKHLTQITVLVTSLFIGGCNGTDTAQSSSGSQVNKNSNQVNPVVLGDRQYHLVTPKREFEQNKAYKLLLAFHGSGQTSKDMMAQASFADESSNYIVAYPQSKVEEWNEGCDCNKPHRLGIDDLSFVEGVVRDIKANYNIIEEELYAVGYSQGGLFTQNLMCNSNLKFKAVASIASPMSTQLAESCDIRHQTNYLMVQGEKDEVLPYEGVPVGNFALVGSEQAIQLIASQNGIDEEAEVTVVDDVTKRTYKNDQLVNQQVSIKGSGHAWSFKNYRTTGEVIKFFDSRSALPLDEHSSLIRVELDESVKDVHIRTMGVEHEGPEIVLLSGFNKNYHADSAWFSLLQPLLAKNHKVHVIERLGNGFSSDTDSPSYVSFAPYLDQVLKKLNAQEIVLVTFSSGNLLAQAWLTLSEPKSVDKLVGMLWIDPDVLLPHSVSLYQSWPVNWYREVEEKLIPHIEAGNWTPRTLEKLEAEREAHSALINVKHESAMDWRYYDLNSGLRASIKNQIIRAKEIINYHDDLNEIFQTPIVSQVPLSVIDTDFESIDIENSEPEFTPALIKWQQEGSEWSKLISEKTGGQYLPLVGIDHMVLFDDPDTILSAISELTK